jgi:hypothetical protein
MGDRLAAWVWVDPAITPSECDRILRAFSEAKQLIAVKRD